MEKSLSRWAVRLIAPLTLMEWGAILVYFYYSHRLAALLHPNFHGLVLVTGLLLLASSVCVLWRDFEAEPQPVHECSDADCCHSHGGMTAGRLMMFLVLSVPVALAAIVSPDSYGAVMIQNRGTGEIGFGATPVPKLADPSKSAQNDSPAAVEVGDLLIAGQTESGMAQYEGKRVEFMGQVFPLGERKFEIVRMLMLCCAADAQMLAVRVESDHDLQLQAMKWATVTGRVGFTRNGGRGVPVITAEKVTLVERPDDPFVYHGGSLPIVPAGNFKVQLPPR